MTDFERDLGQPFQEAAPGPADPFTEPTIQQAYRQGQEDMRRKLTTPRMTGYRIACGIVWAFWTVALLVGAISAFASGSVGTGLLCLVLSGLAAWYDIRIWTLKARRLTFFIVF